MVEIPALEKLAVDEEERRRVFPVAAQRVFLAHAAVSPLPAVAAEALRWFADQASRDQQETPEVWKRVLGTRAVAARLLGCTADEVALIGPTALGLNLVADGLSWRQGDEVVFHAEDYPANVYPWRKLARQGVRPVALRPERPGEITWPLVESALTSRTRLVALASAHFLSGYRVDLREIGSHLRERGILFCVDGIQTLGAVPTPVEFVDFLSADSHKWMLGPLGAGIFMVKRERFAELRPAHLGSWNVLSPHFIAQERVDEFYEGARRYECGSLNVPGILAMRASLEMLLTWGMEAVTARVLELRREVVRQLTAAGWEPVWGLDLPDKNACGIASFRLDGRDEAAVTRALAAAGISASVRHDREGRAHLRVAAHVGNTEEEIGRLAVALDGI